MGALHAVQWSKSCIPAKKTIIHEENVIFWHFFTVVIETFYLDKHVFDQCFRMYILMKEE